MIEPRPNIAFLVANDRHHAGAALPVIQELRKDDFATCRVLSLCEFRGFESPVERMRDLGVPIQELVPFRLRTPSAGSNLAVTGGGARGVLQNLLWRTLLAPSLVENLVPKPNLVVVPNDGAYPYDRICRLLDKSDIPFLVLQEGIRFANPSGSSEGRSAAAAWAVWGPTSGRYFQNQGAAKDKVHVTGSPRFDLLVNRDWSQDAASLREELTAGRPFLTLLSNPIDDLGLVSKAQKLELVRKLASAADPLLAARGWHLVIKLHGRESAGEFQSLLAALPASAPISVVSECPLYPLLTAASGALTFVSSVGLEALLCKVPLAVLEVPGHGFVHDFVASGAASGIAWDQPFEEQFLAWWAGRETRAAAIDDYLENSVAHAGTSACRVAELIRRLVLGSASTPI